MNFYLVLTILLRACLAQKSWKVQMDMQGKMTASMNGAQQWSTTAASNAGVCFPTAFPEFSWLCSAKLVNQSDIISAGGNSALIPSAPIFVVRQNDYAQVLPNGGYRVTLADALPFVSYVVIDSNSSTTWVCSPVLPLPYYGGMFLNNTYTCQGGGMTINITETGGSNGPEIDLNGDSGVSDVVLKQFVSLSIARMRDASIHTYDPYDVATVLKDRKQVAQVAVGWIWFCISVVCLMLVIKLAIWQAWLWPGPAICCTCWMRFALVIWFLLFATVFLAVSAGAGLPGLIIIVIIIVIYLLILKIVYCCRSRGLSSEDDSLASHGFSRYPIKFGTSQNRTLCIVYLLLFLFFVAAACTVKWWDVRDYVVWNRVNQRSEVEYIKPSVATAGALVYSFDGYANKLNVNNQLFKYSTALCGIEFGTVLANDQEKQTEIYDQMIVPYNVDMSIFVPSDYRQYNTVNEWFIRTLKTGVRPVYQAANAIVSPADSRTMTFSLVPSDLLLWIKGEDFTVQTLLGPGYRSTFTNGPMALCRLAPQDYHRFHSPVAGVIIQQGNIAGSLYAVNADGMTSGNDAIFNQRLFTIIQTTNYGNVAVVAIGATCVGSIVVTKSINATVFPGDELGYFQFGGSTVALVFEAGRVTWDADFHAFSSQNVEIFVNMGTRLGLLR